MYAEGYLAVAHVYILVLVLEAVELADGLGNLGTADVDVTLGKRGLQVLWCTILLQPLHAAVVGRQTYLHLIGGQGVVSIVRLRPAEVHLVVGRQLYELVGQRRGVQHETGRLLDGGIRVSVVLAGRQHTGGTQEQKQ